MGNAPLLDHDKIADAIEATTAMLLDDAWYGPSHRVMLGESVAAIVAEALRALASRFEEADPLPSGARIVWLGAHGRAAVIAAVRFLAEPSKRSSSERDDRNALAGRGPAEMARPDSDSKITAS